jgi:3D (Asp-Asp-Asp) domain-containing protein
MKIVVMSRSLFMKIKRLFVLSGAVILACLFIFLGPSAIFLEATAAKPLRQEVSQDFEPPAPYQVTPEMELSEPQDIDYRRFEATAYCDFGITFSGVLVQRGIVAADPRILPIGSIIEVQAGDYTGIYVVMDTGGRVKGKIIDIYMPDYDEAIQFGRQTVVLRVLRHGWLPDPASGMSYTEAG